MQERMVKVSKRVVIASCLYNLKRNCFFLFFFFFLEDLKASQGQLLELQLLESRLLDSFSTPRHEKWHLLDTQKDLKT